MDLRAPLAIIALWTLTAACDDPSLTRLSPQASVVWPAEQGYNVDEPEHGQLLFGTVNTGQVATIEVRIVNGGTADLEMRDLYLADTVFDENGAVLNEVRVEVDPELSFGASLPDWTEQEIANNASYVFDLIYNPLFGTPIRDGLYLVIKHELNEGAPLYIPVVGEGFGDPAPDIYANPAEVDFGTITLGTTADDQLVTVGNAGPSTLETFAVSLSGDDAGSFALDPGSVPDSSFEMGEYGQLSVSFTPTAAGAYEAQVEVASTDGDEPVLIIPLRGVADTSALGDGPIALCGADFDSQPLVTESLDGSDSYDPDGLPLTYSWSLQPPPGSATTLSSTTSAQPSLTLDLAGDYVGSLTVSNSVGQTSLPCTQTIHAIPNENFRVEMYWDQVDDMDLHLLEANPPGTPRTDGDCYYGNCQSSGPDWGDPSTNLDDPTLDLDDISGFGPENINIVSPDPGSPGWYQIFVHDYPGTVYNGSTNVTTNIYLNGVLQQTWNFSMSGEDDDYYVAQVEWPSGVIVNCSGLGGC